MNLTAIHPIAASVLLLLCSNVFMTFAWYAHLKNLNNKPWIIAALASWGIALFEYLLQVPANRIGYTVLSVGQLKILQEVITLACNSGWDDFEDAIQMQCAEKAGCHYLITRNPQDYDRQPARAILPADFLAVWSAK